MDVFDRQTRSKIMAAVRRRDTKPELWVRSYIHAKGLRFRVHVRNLPGTPDIVLTKHRIAIFVHGCFWHNHQECSKSALPKTRTKFWRKKIEGNVVRDRKVLRLLKRNGWRVRIIWECKLNDFYMKKLVKDILSDNSRRSSLLGFKKFNAN
jgi:DNA mismatch endonuclease, patch repair protein